MKANLLEFRTELSDMGSKMEYLELFPNPPQRLSGLEKLMEPFFSRRRSNTLRERKVKGGQKMSNELVFPGRLKRQRTGPSCVEERPISFPVLLFYLSNHLLLQR